jgi:hypothetical protein
MSNLNTPTEDAAQAVFRVTGKCLLANRSVERLAHLDPEKRQSEKSKYEHHLLEAIAAALSIKDEFYKGLAIRQVINVCRNANDIDIEKTLFKGVDHPLLREQIVKDAPELAGERKEVSDEDSACRTVTIHLDGLERDAILHKQCATLVRLSVRSKVSADYDTMLAKAIDWGAPVHFLKDGEPWVKGDWRRLTLWQRVKRKLSLLGGSYVHPDGTIELASKDRC